MSEEKPEPPRRRNLTRALAAVVLVAAVALGLTLVVRNLPPPAPTLPCAPQPQRAAALDAVAQGNLAALVSTGKGRGYADVSFVDATGTKKTLADFAGKKLLLNFWASWCVPCRAEMPALDKVAQQYDGQDFEVIPLNVDIGEDAIDKARTFLASSPDYAHLPLYADPTFDSFKRLQKDAVAIGIPTTLLLDEKACELAVLQGPAEWNGTDGQAVVQALIKG